MLSIIAERLSARQLILRRISAIVCMYVCMYVYMHICVTFRNAIRNLIPFYIGKLFYLYIVLLGHCETNIYVVWKLNNYE